MSTQDRYDEYLDPDISSQDDDDLEILREGIDEIPDDPDEGVKFEFEGDLAGKSAQEISELVSQLQGQVSEQQRSSGSGTGGQSDANVNALQEQVKALQSQLEQMGKSSASSDQRDNGLTDEELSSLYMDNPVEASRKIAELEARKAAQQYAPVLEQTSRQLQDTQLQLREREDPVFKKYGAEVREELNRMTPQTRYHPEALDYAWSRVQGKHIQDIVEMKVEERQKKLEEEAQAREAGSRDPDFVERPTNGGPRRSATGTGSRKRKRIVMTMADQVRARNMGLPVEEYARIYKAGG